MHFTPSPGGEGTKCINFFNFFSSLNLHHDITGTFSGGELGVTSAVALGVLGEAPDHSLHRLLQHRGVPRVAGPGGPGPQPQPRTPVQAVQLQRRGGRRRPGGSGEGGRGMQQGRDGDCHPGPQGGAQGPRRSEPDPGLQPVRADAVRDDVGFHCAVVASAEPPHPTTTTTTTTPPRVR